MAAAKKATMKKKTAKKKAATFDPATIEADWILFNEAYARVKVANNGSRTLAERRLMQLLHAGLPSAFLIVGRNLHDERFVELDPSAWREPNPLTLMEQSGTPGKIRVYGLNPKLISGHQLWFYVSREHFDEMYPSADAAKQVKQKDKSSDRPSRGEPPGPESTKNWRLVVARELIRRAEARDTRPTEAAMVRFCEKTLNHKPNDRDMRELVQFLYGR
jgi:hypothetical protein